MLTALLLGSLGAGWLSLRKRGVAAAAVRPPPTTTVQPVVTVTPPAPTVVPQPLVTMPAPPALLARMFRPPRPGDVSTMEPTAKLPGLITMPTRPPTVTPRPIGFQGGRRMPSWPGGRGGVFMRYASSASQCPKGWSFVPAGKSSHCVPPPTGIMRPKYVGLSGLGVLPCRSIEVK